METLKQNLMPLKRKKALGIHSTFPPFRKVRTVSIFTVQNRHLTTNPSASVLHVHRLLWPRSYHWYHHLSLIQSRWQLHHKSQLSDSSQREDWTLHCRSICCYYYCPTRTTSAHPRRCDFKRRCRFVFQNPRPMLSAGEEEWDRGCWKCSTTNSNY